MKSLFRFAIVLALVVIVSAVSRVTQASSGACLEITSQVVNHVEISTHAEPGVWVHATLNGIDLGDHQDGGTFGADMPYPQVNNSIVGTIDGVECANLPVTVDDWKTDDNGSGDTSDKTYTPHPSPGVACSNLVAIHVVPGVTKNQTVFWLDVMGENPDYPFRVYPGDGSFTEPKRDGGTTSHEPHSYDIDILREGVDVYVTVLGGSEVCGSVHIDTLHRDVTYFRS